MILSNNNHLEAREYLKKAIDISVDFKLQENVHETPTTKIYAKDILKTLPLEGKEINQVLEEFKELLLNSSTNFSSTNFMGFPDSGNSVAAMVGAIFSELIQQNLINQSFCGPTATFAEIAVIQWLREVVGYKTNDSVTDVWDAGGMITTGGTSSNTIAMMLARENHVKGTFNKGVSCPENFKIIIPKGIGHYSINRSQRWIGLGNNTIEIETENFKTNLNELKKTLRMNKGRVMTVVCCAGDSYTMTIDNFKGIYETVKEFDENIWLHADACHGFSLGFSDKLREKINYINLFDSISTDPHKVLFTPYVVSALLVRDPQTLKSISSQSELILNDDFAFGQITPFFGSRNWSSLKLWFLIKNLGKAEIGNLIEKRYAMANFLWELLKTDKDFIVFNNVEINSVMFMYKGDLECSIDNIAVLNSLSKKVYNTIMEEGKYYLHQFPINDDNNIIDKNSIIYPLRYMGGNPNVTKDDIISMIGYIKEIAKKMLEKSYT